MIETSGKILSKELASRIWLAHQEIENATKLRDDMKSAIEKGRDPNPRDGFGRRRNLELGVPSGDSSQRCFNVDPKLAIHVIEAHIVNQQKELADASIAARIELDNQ